MQIPQSYINQIEWSNLSDNNYNQCCDIDWDRSDAELLTRSYEKLGETSQSFYQSHQDTADDTPLDQSKNYNLQLPSFAPQNENTGKAFAHQNWIKFSNSRESEQVLKSMANFTSSLNDGTLNEYFEVLWQRIHHFLNSIVTQIEAHHETLLGSHRQETLYYHQHTEKLILFVTELLQKIEFSIENIKDFKAPPFSGSDISAKEQDLKSVLYSIDQDISRKFRKMLGISCQEGQLKGVAKNVTAEIKERGFPNSNHFIANLENAQKNLLSLQDRMKSLETTNINQTSSPSGIFLNEKNKVNLQTLNAPNNLNFPGLVSTGPQTSQNFISRFFTSSFSGSKIKTISLNKSYKRRRCFSVLALGLAIILSSVSLKLNTPNPSLVSEPLYTPLYSKTEAQNSMTFKSFNPIDLDVSARNLMTSTYTDMLQPQSNRNNISPDVVDEFFRFSQFSLVAY